MKRAIQAALLLAIGAAAIAGPIAFKAWRGAIERSRSQQTADPFRIAGNLYYIGTNYSSAFLLTGPDGDVVLDAGEDETHVPFVMANIATLGVDIRNVKMLITSDPHSAGGVARIQQASGAALWASARGAEIIAKGGDDVDAALPYRALVKIGVASYTPARVDHIVKDGETIHLGPLALTAYLAGAARGCTSWSFTVRDGERELHVVSVCNLLRSAGTRFPGQDGHLERSFMVLRGLPADIWVTTSSRAWGRYRKFAASQTMKNPADAFVDPAGYRAYISDAEDALLRGAVN